MWLRSRSVPIPRLGIASQHFGLGLDLGLEGLVQSKLDIERKC